MTKEISRRSFIKGGLAAACTLAATSIPASASTSKADKYMAALLDISKCVGCEACVDACREVNAHKYPKPQKPFPKMYPSRVPVMDWSDKQDVTDRLTPYNWVYIQNATVEIDGEEVELMIPRSCMHCIDPPCVKLCPWGAARQLSNGTSRIDSDICLGGSKCKAVCPWNIPERQTGVGLYLDILPSMAGNGVMYKCDRCYNRVAKGELPACVEACPEDARAYGPRDEIIKKAHKIAQETNSYIYGEKENGGTNTIYISPVPFEKLNDAIEKGKGMPHFKPAKNTMADANNLAVAMALAPIAGVATAVGKFYKKIKNDESVQKNNESN